MTERARGRPPVPMICPACEGLRTRVLVAQSDPEPPDHEPTVLRIRVCLDCGEQIATAERIVPVERVQRRLLALWSARMGDLRTMRRVLGHEYGGKPRTNGASAPPPLGVEFAP